MDNLYIRCSPWRGKHDCMFAKSYGGPLRHAQGAQPSRDTRACFAIYYTAPQGRWVPEVASTWGPCEKQVPRPPHCGRARNDNLSDRFGQADCTSMCLRFGSSRYLALEPAGLFSLRASIKTTSGLSRSSRSCKTRCTFLSSSAERYTITLMDLCASLAFR